MSFRLKQEILPPITQLPHPITGSDKTILYSALLSKIEDKRKALTISSCHQIIDHDECVPSKIKCKISTKRKKIHLSLTISFSIMNGRAVESHTNQY